jgi:hypothetical protein
LKNLSVICLIAVLALATMGTGYAYWSRTLTVSGTVNAATLDWQFIKTLYNFDSGNDWNADPGFTNIHRVGYDIGSTELIWADSHTVNAVISKAYPDYYDCWTMGVKNTGNMKLTVKEVTLIYNNHEYPMLTSNPVSTLDGVFEFRFLSNTGVTIDPGKELLENIDFHTLASVQYGQQYSFTIHIIGEQTH